MKKSLKISYRFPGKKTPLWLAVLVTAASLSVSCLSKQPQEARVIRVTDGDTVDMDSGATVRYIGIDTPETKRKISGQWVPAEDPFGEQAKIANERLVMGKRVRLEYDVEKKDRYNRTLAYVFVEGHDKRETFVQADLVRRGLAYVYTLPPNVKYVEVLSQAQKQAKEERAGIWAQDLDVPSEQAGNFIGQRRVVTGQVRKVRRSEKTVFLNLDGFTIVIFAKDLENFEKQGIDPVTDYAQRRVSVFGLIKLYRESPEIIISHPSQIEVLD